ncbi:hypothetical protein [Streptomyces acidicola]|uniref:hypothetical protein n=1 Tax=Streptomyces acidicola TaxID=2596892 RepID=UPI0018839CD1|nr:hypothetical protein [Streptomyces acidicola]
MHVPPRRPGHTEAVSGPVLLVLLLRRTAARWVRRMAGAGTAGTGRRGVGEGAP